MNIKTSFENRAKKALINSICTLLENNPESSIPKIFKLSKTLVKDSVTKKILADLEKSYEEKPTVKTYVDNSLTDIDPEIKRNIFLNLINRNSKSSNKSEKYLPISMILNPNASCNLGCLNCSIYNYKNESLSINEFDSIVNNIHKHDINYIVLFGGEPFLLDSILNIFENNKDIIFIPVTNGTLFNEKNSSKLLKSGNVIPIISLSNNKTNVDHDYGNGTYNKIISGMKLLKSKGIPFGTLTAVNTNNLSTVTSDQFVDSLILNGSKFSIYSNSFCSNAQISTSLTVNERNILNKKVISLRNTKPYFFVDLFNDPKYVSQLFESDISDQSSFIFSKMPFNTLQSISLDKILRLSSY